MENIPNVNELYVKIKPVAKKIADKSYEVVKIIDEARNSHKEIKEQVLSMYKWLRVIEENMIAVRDSLDEYAVASNSRIEHFIHGKSDDNKNDNLDSSKEEESGKTRLQELEEDPF